MQNERHAEKRVEKTRQRDEIEMVKSLESESGRKPQTWRG